MMNKWMDGLNNEWVNEFGVIYTKEWWMHEWMDWIMNE